MTVRRFAEDAHALRVMIHGFGLASGSTAILAATATGLAIGIPTRLIVNSWFIRMTPTRPQDYAVWVATSMLIGVIAGSYLATRSNRSGYRVMSGGLASYLAVGCPICNKVVVSLLGVSGAMSYFAPAQLYIGIGSVLLLSWTLILRARALAGCQMGSESLAL